MGLRAGVEVADGANRAKPCIVAPRPTSDSVFGERMTRVVMVEVRSEIEDARHARPRAEQARIVAISGDDAVAVRLMEMGVGRRPVDRRILGAAAGWGIPSSIWYGGLSVCRLRLSEAGARARGVTRERGTHTRDNAIHTGGLHNFSAVARGSCCSQVSTVAHSAPPFNSRLDPVTRIQARAHYSTLCLVLEAMTGNYSRA